MQALERALSALPALPALIEVWPVALLALAAAVAAAFVSAHTLARAPSEAALQRFRL
jgi:hypothetical protein